MLAQEIRDLEARGARPQGITTNLANLQSPAGVEIPGIQAQQADLGAALASLLFGEAHMQMALLEGQTADSTLLDTSNSAVSKRSQQVGLQNHYSSFRPTFIMLSHPASDRHPESWVCYQGTNV